MLKSTQKVISVSSAAKTSSKCIKKCSNIVDTCENLVHGITEIESSEDDDDDKFKVESHVLQDEIVSTTNTNKVDNQNLLLNKTRIQLERTFLNQADKHSLSQDQEITDIFSSKNIESNKPNYIKDDVNINSECQSTKKTALSEFTPQGDCPICNRLAKASCSGCHKIFYCSGEHQKQHWKVHKSQCKELSKISFRVERNSQYGRYLVATTDIKQGELIISEKPMVVGPRQLTKPICLGCHKEFKTQNGTKGIKLCCRCNWPLCDDSKCQDSLNHDPECRIIRYGGVKVDVDVGDKINMMYSCITILRALSLKESHSNRDLWTSYTKFESHLEERMKTPVYFKVNKEKVVFFIQHYLKLMTKYSDLEILEACGKLDTNCFEIRQFGINLRAMYPTACLMSHNCRPNTRHTFSIDDYTINLYATVPISKGTIISSTYTHSLWSTLNRREHLKMSKCFWCQCERCEDPTEFNTFLSSILCLKCGGKMLQINSLNCNEQYRCQKCKKYVDVIEVKKRNQELTEEIKRMNNPNVERLEEFLRQHSANLLQTQQFSREIQYSILCRMRGPLAQATTQQLIRKSHLCKELLSVADVIEPGSTRWRGQLLLEYHNVLVEMTSRAVEDGRMTKLQAQAVYEDCQDKLDEAIEILHVEPEDSKLLHKPQKQLKILMS